MSNNRELEQSQQATEGEKRPPYFFSQEELTMPQGRLREQKAWLDNMIAQQKEGIDHGVRPQNIRGIPEDLAGRWKRQVWSYYRKTLSSRDKAAASKFLEGSDFHFSKVGPPQTRMTTLRRAPNYHPKRNI